MQELKDTLAKVANVFLVYILPAWIIAVVFDPTIFAVLQADWKTGMPIVFNLLLIIIGRYLKERLPADSQVKKVL